MEFPLRTLPYGVSGSATVFSMDSVQEEFLGCRAFVSTHPLVHKHVKMSVGKWIMKTTRPHKYVQIPEDQNFLGFTLLAMIISKLDQYPKMLSI